jgi:hypothetical protein
LGQNNNYTGISVSNQLGSKNLNSTIEKSGDLSNPKEKQAFERALEYIRLSAQSGC